MPKDKRREPRLRAVLDTNVFISAFSNPPGTLSHLWKLVLEQRFVLLISPAIIRETARILRHRFQWSESRIQERVRVLASVAELIVPRILPEAVQNDPDDNHIVACAVEGKADLIVSGDRDLLTLGSYAGIPIVRPADFLRTVG